MPKRWKWFVLTGGLFVLLVECWVVMIWNRVFETLLGPISLA